MVKDRKQALVAGISLLVATLIGLGVFAISDWPRPYKVNLIEVVGAVEQPQGLNIPEPIQIRDLDPYRGLGTWIDGYDFDHTDSADVRAVVEEMSRHGITTIYLQSGRVSKDSTGLLEDPWVIAEWLLYAHEFDMDVVAWFLPKFRNETDDLAYLKAAADFEVLGHSFDGVGVDIEWVDDEDTTNEERNARLIKLSEEIDDHVGSDALAAIVLPPPFLSEVNDKYWPDFPWDEIAPHYDVWLPMAYWSNRSNASGYGDGYNYSLTSIEDIRTLIDDPEAPVHSIGGIGGSAAEDRLDGAEPIAGVDDLSLFAKSLVDGDAIGGSIYDWYTQDSMARRTMRDLFSTGVASPLAVTRGTEN